MQLTRSRALATTLDFLDETPSTNDILVRMPDAPDFAVVATLSQTAGRGRLGRVWVAPPGKTLAVSVLLRPRMPSGESLGLAHFSWLPLVAGLAMTRAIDAVLPDPDVAVKWPNDVQIEGLKVCGILTELRPGADGVVVGAGVNLTLDRSDLPTPTSTSLSVAGASGTADILADSVLVVYLRELRNLVDRLLRAGGDAASAGIQSDVAARCSTLGREVRVELPDGTQLYGAATDLDAAGQLIVETHSDRGRVTVAAGDVTHLRYE